MNLDYLLNYGVLGFFTVLVLIFLMYLLKEFRGLFNEYRERLDECNKALTCQLSRLIKTQKKSKKKLIR